MGILKLFIWVTWLVGALAASAQTNLAAFTNNSFSAQNISEIRAACVEERRFICGKILKVVPDGLMIESGYTNLLRAPITKSWFASGAVSASRATKLVEDNKPNAICVGLVLLNHLPGLPGAKPKLYDYVLIEAYPVGQFTYIPVGYVHRTVRKFSASLDAAILWKLNHNK